MRRYRFGGPPINLALLRQPDRAGNIARHDHYGSRSSKETIPITEAFPVREVLTGLSGTMTGTTASGAVAMTGKRELQIRLETAATVEVERGGEVTQTYSAAKDVQQLLKFSGESVRLLVTGTTRGMARIVGG